MVWEVVWDLGEHNFRLELLTLDQCVIPRDAMTDSERAERDDMVYACFPNKFPVTQDFPTKDEGLGAAHWESRKSYVEAFALLLAVWPGREGGRLKFLCQRGQALGSRSLLVREQIEGLEKVAFPFYCQTFFEYFGRAPTIPRYLLSSV
ncbi:hypothetical protein GALMADRAFT_81847 [Galerina marginata CBS 339.88]|uniref:Uncharacterized protein n=1 Tax=Galerina marginata (strain CBS 339.88) TaxID=685588 RepID=A0A067S6F2_GALM3|nr:hypothetical protein GALMADRAFT_81847 [Galerina marginata CBS 339.88]